MGQRKSFQVLVQGTFGEGQETETYNAVTSAVEKALLALDTKGIWISSQMFASIDMTRQHPAFTIVFGSLEEPGAAPTEIVSTPKPEIVAS